MEKVFVENTEISISEKTPKESSDHSIRGNFYVQEIIVKKEFKSSIYKYSPAESMIVGKVNRFSMEYFKIIFSNDKESKAWNLIELPQEVEVKVKRLSPDMFIIIGDSKGKDGHMSQVSFCRIKPSTKVEEFAISFCKLNHFYIMQDKIIIGYSDFSKEEDRETITIASYNFDGKLLKTHYEYTKCKGQVKESGVNDISAYIKEKN